MSVFDILDKLKTEREPALTGNIEYIICGLGNPGTQYENTRHNAGFMAIDTIAKNKNAEIKKLKFKSLTGDIMLGGVRCLLMKPTTFMNNSGEAVREALSFYKLPPEKLIVIYDDISMDVGRTRIRRKGSDGGHNGIKSIILCTNSDSFPRIKIGVGAKPHPDYNLADWVLSPFLKEQAEALESSLSNAAAAAELMVQDKTDEAMNKYNK
ncbi:MAG: aminoacyl-tRNA hydrolase [Ruminiclostridium sp.]|nr:aminoacyl-tRNA hydrolase [Ruminiclostridium sp.]